METTEGKEGENCDVPSLKRTGHVHQRSDFSQAPWSIMLRKAELKHRHSRDARNFGNNVLILYELFLEPMKPAKQRNQLSLAARDVAGRQCILVKLKISTKH